MGKGNKQTTTQNQTQNSTSSTQLPDWVTNQATQNLNFANQVAGNLQAPQQSSPYGFTQDQLNAFQQVAQMAGQSGANDPANQYAMQMTQQAGNWQAPQVYAPGYSAQNVGMPQGYQAAMVSQPGNVSAQNVTAQNISADPIQAALAQANLVGPAQNASAASGTASQIDPNSISRIQAPDTNSLISTTQQLQNPYTQDVVNTTLTDLDRARQMTQNTNAAQAAQAGAFGSSRQGVMDSLTNADFARQAAATSAQLNQQGYGTALSAAQNQQQLGQQAALANQGVDAQTAAQNAQLAQGMSLANVGNQQQVNLANQGAQNQFTTQNQNAQNQFGLANQSALNQIALANQQNNFGTQQSNQGANLQASLANQQANLQAGLANQNVGLQTGLANQSSLNNAGQFNSGQNFQASLANQAAQNTGGQFNAGQNMQAFLANQAASQAQAGMGLNAGAQAANIGSGQFGQQMQALQALLGTGGQQQQLGQSGLDTQYQNAVSQNNLGPQQLALLMQALQSTPYGTTTTGTGTSNGTSTQTQTPGLLSSLGSLAQMAAPFMMMSDIRLKENIVPMHTPGAAAFGVHMRDPLKAVRRIRPAQFNFKGSPFRQLGLLAQNVEQAAPEAVRDIPTGNPAMPTVKAIHTPAMLGLLTGAVHQLDQKISRKKGLAYA